MGYSSADSSLWWNMAGVVAAFQPTRAPGPLDARYNVALGGTNLYRAEPGVLPTWSAATGWTFNGSTQYLNTSISVPCNGTWSALIRFTNFANLNCNLFGCITGGTAYRFQIAPVSNVGGTTAFYGNGGYGTKAPTATSGVLGIIGPNAYRNGVLDVAIAAGAGGQSTIYIGAAYNGGTANPEYFGASNTQALSVYSRTLSPAEVWTASRQMAYCDTNSEWNAWAPRRQWFFYTAPAEVAVHRRLMGDGIARSGLFGGSAN